MADIGDGHGQRADAFVTTEEAARLAGVSARTVRRWAASGEVEAVQADNGWLVSVSDVRLRAARGHVRPRPGPAGSSGGSDTQSDIVPDTSALIAVLSPVLIAHAEQVERLTREAMEAKARADQLERDLQVEREQLLAVRDEIAGAMTAAAEAVSLADAQRERADDLAAELKRIEWIAELELRHLISEASNKSPTQLAD